jgi:hypothetical protein
VSSRNAWNRGISRSEKAIESSVRRIRRPNGRKVEYEQSSAYSGGWIADPRSTPGCSPLSRPARYWPASANAGGSEWLSVIRSSGMPSSSSMKSRLRHSDTPVVPTAGSHIGWSGSSADIVGLSPMTSTPSAPCASSARICSLERRGEPSPDSSRWIQPPGREPGGRSRPRVNG